MLCNSVIFNSIEVGRFYSNSLACLLVRASCCKHDKYFVAFSNNMIYCGMRIWKLFKECSTMFFEAFCPHYLLIMSYRVLACKVIISSRNVMSVQGILDKVMHKLLVLF